MLEHDIRRRMAMQSLVVCVDYDDFLAITLPRNKRWFARTLVITAPHDTRTQALARREGCDLWITDAFYRDGAKFNKGRAMEEGFARLGRTGWLCVWDADIVMPERLGAATLRTDCLYVPSRAILEDAASFRDDLDWPTLPCPTQRNEFDGYCQIFHADGAGEPPWYSTDWCHAGGCDSDFSSRYPIARKVRLPENVLHLGPEGFDGQRVGLNWYGRVIPRIDTGEVQPAAEERERAVRHMIMERPVHGLVRERILCGPPLPNRMAFYWSGRMSWLRYLTLLTFRRLNPDWQMILYTSDVSQGSRTWQSLERDDAEYVGCDYRDRVDALGVEVRRWQSPIPAGGPAHASDLCGWWYLANEGGWYSDMDILWLLPMDALQRSTAGVDAVFCLEEHCVAIGFLGGRPCPLWSDFWAMLCGDVNGTRYQHYGADAVYRFGRLKSSNGRVTDRPLYHLQCGYPANPILVVPDATVYPLDWRYVERIFESRESLPCVSVGVHWFGGHATAQKWNRRLTERNWRMYPRSTFTDALRSIEHLL